MSANDFNSAARTLEVGGKSYRYFNLQSLEEQGLGKISKLPSPCSSKDCRLK